MDYVKTTAQVYVPLYCDVCEEDILKCSHCDSIFKEGDVVYHYGSKNHLCTSCKMKREEEQNGIK